MSDSSKLTWLHIAQELRAENELLRHHLRQAHRFVENTAAFGRAARSGILQAGQDKSTAWNIDESKSALNRKEVRNE